MDVFQETKKITLANVLPSKFCTICFTQSSVSSGTVARLLEYRAHITTAKRFEN